jgi:superfamily II DNA or RNA helicase
MTGSLREFNWPRFLKAPDGQLVARLYEPGLRRAVKYERCCAYFSSSVLSAAAAGFGAFIERILAGEIAKKPALHLLVNEELSEADVDALLQRGQDVPLIETLLARFGTPQTALQKRRLEMLGWLVANGWLEVRVGFLRLGGGIVHAKFGQFTDAAGDGVTFQGSDNESAQGVRGHYEELEISCSWRDAERDAYYRERFKTLWGGTDPTVATVSLPEAVRQKVIRFTPEVGTPIKEAEDDLQRRRAAMLWGYALAAPFMPDRGAATCDVMAPVTLWPHQRRVVAEVAEAWPVGRLLCDEVGMGKTVEAILILRRLLAGRGVARALILPPANLLPQWQGELREKGGLRVPRAEGSKKLVWPDGSEEAVSGLAEALAQRLLLLSRETARTEGNLSILLAARPWDLVLLDEGHAARRANQVEGEFNSPTLLLGLLRRLQATGQTRNMMILSATPMQTHPWEPWDLLQILGEGGLWLSGFHVVRRFYEAVARFEAGVLFRDDAVDMARILATTPNFKPRNGLGLPDPGDVSGFAEALRFLPLSTRDEAVGWLRSCSPLLGRMHRNTRQTLRRYYERGLLDRPPPKREVREDPFDFATEEERSTYDAVKDYIDRRFDELEAQRAGKGFVMTIYRRRAASSPLALRKSLERREMGLKAVIAQRAFDDTLVDVEDPQELQDLLNVQLTSALPETPAEAEAELRQVQILLEKIDNLGGLDTKRDHAVDCLKRLTADGRAVLVFTSYTDTMEYLRDVVMSAGVPVASYSGGGGAIRVNGKWATVTKEQVTAALAAGKIRALVCTDAASEGSEPSVGGGADQFRLALEPLESGAAHRPH